MTESIAPGTESAGLSWPLPWLRCTLLAITVALLGGCSASNDDSAGIVVPADTDVPGEGNNPPLGSEPDMQGQYAYVATRASDYGSGRIDRISLADGNTVDGSYPATQSDIFVDTDSVNIYQIGRFKLDSVTRFDAVDTSIVDYQYSVNGDDTTYANPQDIAFVDQTKAYLTRRESDKLWVIDPQAQRSDAFRLAELDLGAYDTDSPNMTDAIIVDDKLFVLVERLLESPQSQIPDKRGYLVVFNTITDTEIDTGQGGGGLKGIELLVTNPTSLQYNAVTGQIYVVGRGNYYEDAAITDDFHSGGVQVIDPTTYQQSLVLDDGTDADNQGYFVQAVVIDATHGYLVTYKSFLSTLRTFNPATGSLSDELIEGLQDVDITTIAKGPDNHLWVGINDDTPGFYRIDLDTGLLAAERVATELIPQDIEFLKIPQQP